EPEGHPRQREVRRALPAPGPSRSVLRDLARWFQGSVQADDQPEPADRRRRLRHLLEGPADLRSGGRPAVDRFLLLGPGTRSGDADVAGAGDPLRARRVHRTVRAAVEGLSPEYGWDRRIPTGGDRIPRPLR